MPENGNDRIVSEDANDRIEPEEPVRRPKKVEKSLIPRKGKSLKEIAQERQDQLRAREKEMDRQRQEKILAAKCNLGQKKNEN